MSPIQYLKQLRLEKARELLEGSFKNIGVIRFEIGIKDASHFIRDFKERFGATPSEYRKRHWKKVEDDES